jgi:flavin reductase (DIM6/NTAB) family NADH-FMN oxidoreductase RutF
VQEIIEKIANGVSVVTSKSGDTVNGLSIAWMSQVCMVPPLVMVALGKERYTHELIQKSKVFAISILSERQRDIAKHFGLQSGRKVNKFNNVKYEVKKTGSPILHDCLAYLDCKVCKAIDVNDHTIFVGEVVDASIRKNETPLIYNSKDYF